MNQPIKIGGAYQPFGSYTLQMARNDSDRAKTQYIERFIIRLRKANDRYFGTTMKCLFATAIVVTLSVKNYSAN